jgi:hypothetical protein
MAACEDDMPPAQRDFRGEFASAGAACTAI